jgi:hypothetical protein
MIKRTICEYIVTVGSLEIRIERRWPPKVSWEKVIQVKHQSLLPPGFHDEVQTLLREYRPTRGRKKEAYRQAWRTAFLRTYERDIIGGCRRK